MKTRIPASPRINLRFKDPQLLKRLSVQAKRNNRSCNAEILHLLAGCLAAPSQQQSPG